MMVAKEYVRNGALQLLLIVFIFGTTWSIFSDEALPRKGKIFTLFVLYILANVLGEVFELVKLPPLLGMLLSGFLITNVLKLELDTKTSSSLRSMALAIILLKAGLGLDPVALKKLSGLCLRLAFIPCLVETVVYGLIGKYILDIPFEWSFLLGFVISAVSPAVTVPGMIALQEKNLGTEKGIPTLVIAAASVDDVLAITGFGVVLGFVFVNHDNPLLWRIAKGPVEALVGLVSGVVIGFLIRKLTTSSEENPGTGQKVLITLAAGSACIFVSNAIEFGGAGPLAALTLAFVAGLDWRASASVEPVESIFKSIWLIVQPFLFGLIGAEVHLSSLESSSLINGMAILVIGLVFRCSASMLALMGSDLTTKEKIFVSVAWMPKATVQAAFGPVALDIARQLGDEQAIKYASLLLTVAVQSILVTAPLGAIAIALGGPKLLSQPLKDSNQQTMSESEMVPADRQSESEKNTKV